MKLELNNEVFASFAYFSAILVIKMTLMSFLTARHRFKNLVFANPEDASSAGKKAKVEYTHPDIERVRRAHLNDIENIGLFYIIGFLYTFTNPAAGTANLLFKVFTGSRIAHTIVYAVLPMPQPSRAIAWAVGVMINIYMAYKVITFMS